MLIIHSLSYCFCALWWLLGSNSPSQGVAYYFCEVFLHPLQSFDMLDFFTTLFYACCVCISSYQLAAFVQLHSSHPVKVGGRGEGRESENRPWGIYFFKSIKPTLCGEFSEFSNKSYVFIMKQLQKDIILFKIIFEAQHSTWQRGAIDLLKWTIFQSKYISLFLIFSSSHKATL